MKLGKLILTSGIKTLARGVSFKARGINRSKDTLKEHLTGFLIKLYEVPNHPKQAYHKNSEVK